MIRFRFQRPGFRRPTLLGRATAWLAAVSVIVLTWLAADPAAHDCFHPRESAALTCVHPAILAALHLAHENASLPRGMASAAHVHHRCVICDFAAGCTDVTVIAFFIFAGFRIILQLRVVSDAVRSARSRDKHAPSCGPPLSA